MLNATQRLQEEYGRFNENEWLIEPFFWSSYSHLETKLFYKQHAVRSFHKLGFGPNKSPKCHSSNSNIECTSLK